MLKIRKIMKSQKGFTLVELIVVIAILGILAALVVPRFAGTLETQKKKTDLANIRTVQSAYDLYLADNNGEGLTGMITNDTNAFVGAEKYIDELPEMQSSDDTFPSAEGATEGWSTKGNLITYNGKTYSEWVADDE